MLWILTVIYNFPTCMNNNFFDKVVKTITIKVSIDLKKKTKKNRGAISSFVISSLFLWECQWCMGNATLDN